MPRQLEVSFSAALLLTDNLVSFCEVRFYSQSTRTASVKKLSWVDEQVTALMNCIVIRKWLQTPSLVYVMTFWALFCGVSWTTWWSARIHVHHKFVQVLFRFRLFACFCHFLLPSFLLRDISRLLRVCLLIQLIAWKDTSPKRPITLWVGH